MCFSFLTCFDDFQLLIVLSHFFNWGHMASSKYTWNEGVSPLQLKFVHVHIVGKHFLFFFPRSTMYISSLGPTICDFGPLDSIFFGCNLVAFHCNLGSSYYDSGYTRCNLDASTDFGDLGGEVS